MCELSVSGQGGLKPALESFKRTLKMKVGIIGNGFVGKATALLASEHNEVVVYDVDSSKCVPQGLTLAGMKDCSVLFVCVPTPMNRDGSCHTAIVEKVIEDCRDLEGFVVVRSTVPVGFSEQHKVHFMPEFLTEKNWEQDFMTCKSWIVGVNTSDPRQCTFVEVMSQLIRGSNVQHTDDIRFCTTKEAELTKYFRNCFLATKVAFCNEVSEFCREKNINYENVRQLAVLDDRVGQSHTMVPGHDGKRGFGGTCLPKDVNSLINQFYAVDKLPLILTAVQNRNESFDRPERDWNMLSGRAVVNFAPSCNLCSYSTERDPSCPCMMEDF